jgi:hypothetical protein
LVKLNDKVYPVFNMNQVGTVVDLLFQSVDTHMVGGSMQQRLWAIVKLDADNQLIKVPAEDLMRCA